MADPFVAEVRIFGFNFAPVGWATCDGQIMPITQNTALFALLGTMYGGDGQRTFALPNLQGCFAIGTGQGPGLSSRSVGEAGGSAAVALTPSQMPTHGHSLNAAASATSSSPGGNALAPPVNGSAAYRIPGALTPMAVAATGGAGSSAAHNNLSPYQTLIFCIALQGIFPPRS